PKLLLPRYPKRNLLLCPTWVAWVAWVAWAASKPLVTQARQPGRQYQGPLPCRIRPQYKALEKIEGLFASGFHQREGFQRIQTNDLSNRQQYRDGSFLRYCCKPRKPAF